MIGRLETIVFLLCLMCVAPSMGQNLPDSVRQLETVTIAQSRLNDHVIAAYELPIDSAMLSVASNGSVTDLLRKHGIGHIRSYGQNGPALPSFRGTGSSHTAVLWNGINIVSPLSGQLDLSIIPVALFEDASVQTGGSASLAGNGSIGGNIHLNNKVSFGQGLRVTASSHVGSFGYQYYDAGAKFSNRTFATSTRLFFTASENNYKFTNRSVFPAERQVREHSAFQQHGILQQLHWQTRRSGIFSFKLWYQKSRYEVPNPTSILRRSQASEDNRIYRLLGGWNFTRKAFDLNYHAAFIKHDLEYADPLLAQFSRNRFYSTSQNVEANVNFAGNAQLTSGLHYTWEQGASGEFGNGKPSRNRVAFFSAYKLQPSPKWSVGVSAREELVNGRPSPLSPGVSVKYNASTRTNVFTNLSRNYRIPTFNDLYWIEGSTRGNPDLKTETSLSAEAGIEFTLERVTFKGVGFSNHVDNWIAWTPTGGQLWTTHNIKKVWSRGIEGQLSLSAKAANANVRLSGQYSFTKSTNQDVYRNGNPNEKGKQLILTPIHEGSTTVEIEWRKYTIRIVNAYTGEQFNDSDNTPYNIVADYVISNIWLGRAIEIKKIKATLTAEINNAFDVEYYGRPGYPLPGRNFKAGIQFHLDKPNKL